MQTDSNVMYIVWCTWC